MRKTKIVATICGLPIWTSELVEQSIIEGVDIFRISSSFRPKTEDERIFNAIKKISKKVGKEVEILHDINKGVKKRLLTPHDVNLSKGDIITLGLSDSKNYDFCVDWLDLKNQIDVGQFIIIGDGEVALKIMKIDETFLTCIAENGGLVKSRKAVNIQFSNIFCKSINELNLDDIDFSSRLKFDYVALSFVKSIDDIKSFRAYLTAKNLDYNPKIVSKIETIEAIDNLESIVEHSDGIMVARGDLAIQANFAKLGVLQSKIIKECIRQDKFCIIATQMFESIIERYIPSRAEIIDITNAVFQKASAVMLGPETCNNTDAIRAIRTLKEIIIESEKRFDMTIDQSNTFIHGLENSDFSLLKSVKKSEYHSHMPLAIPMDRFRNIVGSDIAAPPNYLNLAEFEDYVTGNLTPFLKNRILFEAISRECINFAIEDNIDCLEISISIAHVKKYQSTYFYCKFSEGLKFEYKNKINYKPEIGLRREKELSEIEPWIYELIDCGIFTSIDLTGNELACAPNKFQHIYRYAKQKGLKLKAHVGEFGDAKSVINTINLLELDEVQHGISVSKCTNSMNWIRENKIGLNICPSSNVALGCVLDIKAHPIKILYENGVDVTINTDDCSIFNSSLSNEYFKLFQNRVLSSIDLNQIRLNSLNR